MNLSFKVEIQPTRTQLRSLLQHAGNARWAFNWGLRRKQEAWEARRAALAAGTPKDLAPKVPTAIDLHKNLVVLKKKPLEEGGVPWMYGASKCAPQEALRNLDKAFQNFFRRVKAGQKPGFPRFKSKSKGVGGFTLTGSIRSSKRSIQLPVLGRLRIKPGDRGYLPEGSHTQAHVTERAGRWYVSVLGPDVPEAMPNGGATVGLDLGVARLVTLSDGTVIENPKALERVQHKLKRSQKNLSRKQKGSMNRRKARTKVAKVHARITNLRKDALHKATTSIAKKYGIVVMENLRVSNMMRSVKGPGKRSKAGLNRVLSDASFGEFRRMLEYKSKLYGCELVFVNPAHTSQRCSVCGYTDESNRRSQSAFQCLRCGYEENADLNASRNILGASKSILGAFVNNPVAASCAETLNACGGDVSPDFGHTALVRRTPLKQESGMS